MFGLGKDKTKDPLFEKGLQMSKSQQDFELRIQQLNHGHELKIKELVKDQELELKDKEFQINHFKDEKVKELRKLLTQKSEDLAVLKKENEMLDKITNLNADIIDIKDLVANLIKKLPDINITSLSVGGNNGSEK